MLSGGPYKTNIGKLYLSPIRKANIRGTPEKIKKLLQPLGTMDVNSSDENITAYLKSVKEDFELMDTAQIQLKEQLALNKALMEGFTDNFKQAMKKTRNELNLNDADTCPEISEALKVCMKEKEVPITSKKTIEKRNAVLKGASYLKEDYESPESDDESKLSYDYMSGIWKMTESRTKSTAFKITYKGYNSYCEGVPHWLEYPEVSPDVIENSKHKCLNWLQKLKKFKN